MANYRLINTAIWKDEWFVGLKGDEQRMFIYLLTNPQTNIAGIYQISLREMAFDTGLDDAEIKRIFRDRLQVDGKAFYELGYVILKNWYRHQHLNPNQRHAAITFINALPEWLRQALLDPSKPFYMPLESYLNTSIELGNPLLILRTKRREENNSSLRSELEGKGGSSRRSSPSGRDGSSHLKPEPKQVSGEDYWKGRV